MEVFKIVGFAIFAVIMVIVIKEQNKEIALILTISTCVGLMIFSISKMSGIIEMLDNLVSKSGIDKNFLNIILKVTAISYIVEFGKNVCLDAGQSAIATKLEMSGKVLIVAISIPIIGSLINILTGLV